MKAHHAACLSVSFLILFAIISAVAGTSRITIAVPPIAGRAPASVKIRVTVPPAADQRVLRVEAGSEHFYRASEVPLDGMNGPATTWMEWRDLPAGRYVVAATVASQTRVVARETRSFLVVTGLADGPE